jgi:hypothetical protein
MAYFYAERRQLVTLEKPFHPCDVVTHTFSAARSNRK